MKGVSMSKRVVCTADDEEDTTEESGSDDEEEKGGGEEEKEGSERGPGDLVFPASYSVAIAQLLETAQEAGKGIKVSDLHLASKEEKLGLAFALWSEGVICSVPKARST